MHLASTAVFLALLRWQQWGRECVSGSEGGQSATVFGRDGKFALCSVATLMIIELRQKDVASA